MTDNTYLLGIDFGTESVRAAIFDMTGRPVSFAATAYRTTHPHPGWPNRIRRSGGRRCRPRATR